MCKHGWATMYLQHHICIRYTHETQREVYVQLIIQGVPFRSYLVRYWHWNGEKWRSPKKNIKFVSDNSVFKHLEFTKKPRSPVSSLKNVDIRCSMGCPWLTTDSPHPSGHPILGAKFRRGRHWGGILSERWWNTQPEGLVIGDKKWIGETRSDDFDHYQLLKDVKMWRCDGFPEMSFYRVLLFWIFSLIFRLTTKQHHMQHAISLSTWQALDPPGNYHIPCFRRYLLSRSFSERAPFSRWVSCRFATIHTFWNFWSTSFTFIFVWGSLFMLRPSQQNLFQLMGVLTPLFGTCQKGDMKHTARRLLC